MTKFLLLVFLVFVVNPSNAERKDGDTLSIKKKFNIILINDGVITYSKAKSRYQEVFEKRVNDTLFYKVKSTDIFGIWIEDNITIAKVKGVYLIRNSENSPFRTPSKYSMLYNLHSKYGDKWSTVNLFDSAEGTVTFDGKTFDSLMNEYLYVFKYNGDFGSHTDHLNRFYVSEKKGIVRLDYNNLYPGKQNERAISVSDDYIKRRKLKEYIRKTK